MDSNELESFLKLFDKAKELIKILYDIDCEQLRLEFNKEYPNDIIVHYYNYNNGQGWDDITIPFKIFFLSDENMIKASWERAKLEESIERAQEYLKYCENDVLEKKIRLRSAEERAREDLESATKSLNNTKAYLAKLLKQKELNNA